VLSAVLKALACTSLTLMIAACGLGAPGFPDPSVLNAWSASATLDEQGTTVTATYEDWPIFLPPWAFVCTTDPGEVFGEGDQRYLLDTNPSCEVAAVSLENGRRLRLSIDRSLLPSSFDGLESWHLVIAIAVDDWNWSLKTVIPASIPRLVPTQSDAS
jgi:hypothetical protein